MHTITTRALIMASALALPFAGSTAFAQDTAAQADSGGLEDIVVTAQRQAQSVLDVPLSITAISGENLDNAGIRQMSDLQLTTPGFVPSNSSGYNQMFIRGIGNSIFVGADPSVATFIDDVPRVFGSMVNNFVDVERVEVIKGAPGALYGRNATGGAVNIITRQPDTEDTSGKARFAFGDKSTFNLSGFVNVALADSVAMTFSAERRTHGNYIRNVARNPAPYTAAMFPNGSLLGTAAQTAALMNSGLKSKKGYADEDFWAVGSKLLFKLGDNFKITLAADYSKKNDDNGNGLYNLTPEYATVVLSNFFNNFTGAQTTPATLAPLAVHAPKKFTTAQYGEGHVKLKDYGGAATAVLSLPTVDLTSITSYRKNRSRFLTELGFTPFNYLAANVDINKSVLYQELRAVSSGDGPLSYVGGASYLKAKFAGGLLTDLLTPVPFLQKIPSGSGRYTVTNWSAYLQLAYDVSEDINVMVSGRYVNEKNDASSLNPLTGTNDPFVLREKKFLPAATVKYSLAGGGNVYARWARGFKAGGIVPVIPMSIFPNPRTQGGVFKGESVDTYEIGLRSPLADNKVQVSAAIFYNDYRDVQVAAHARPNFPLISIAVVNAGSARTYGAEASVTARVADPVTLGVSAGYLNAKYKNFRILANPVLEDLDLSGSRMINSPKWQFSFNGDLDQPITDDLRAVGNFVVSYTDKVRWQQSGVPGFLPDSVGKSYFLVNARAGVKSTDDSWEIAVYAKNLFNSNYSVFGNSAASYGNILAYGDPRIVGIEANVKF
jgi:iron complex outermembrane receptor protein